MRSSRSDVVTQFVQLPSQGASDQPLMLPKQQHQHEGQQQQQKQHHQQQQQQQQQAQNKTISKQLGCDLIAILNTLVSYMLTFRPYILTTNI